MSWYLQNQGAKPDYKEKILVYSAHGSIGGQFIGVLEEEGMEYVVGEKRLGDVPDQSIEGEILSVSPTHVAFFTNRTHDPGNAMTDDLEGGPDKLAINIHENLYGPLLLAELCRKFDIHFTYIGSGCLFKYDKGHPVGGKPFTEEDRPNYFRSSCSVVKSYTDRLLPHYKNVLNVHMQLPISADASPRDLVTKLPPDKKIQNIAAILPELLPELLKLMKERHTGTINLVNPGCDEHTETCKEEVDPSIKFKVINEGDKMEFAQSRCGNCHLSTDILGQSPPRAFEAK